MRKFLLIAPAMVALIWSIQAASAAQIPSQPLPGQTQIRPDITKVYHHCCRPGYVCGYSCRRVHPVYPEYPPRSCRYWHHRCIENWGYDNPDYVGCMRFHGCY